MTEVIPEDSKYMLLSSMKTALKLFAGLLLLFNGTGALYGGWYLITDPTGKKIGLSLSYLQHTPFHNYLIPGIVLFIVNGLCSFLGLIALIAGSKRYPFYILTQGILLTGWIIVQMMMVQMVYFLHYILGATGILLIVCGWILAKLKRQK